MSLSASVCEDRKQCSAISFIVESLCDKTTVACVEEEKESRREKETKRKRKIYAKLSDYSCNADKRTAWKR